MSQQLLGTKMNIIGLDKWTGSYAEIGQTNPLRWQNLKPVEGGYEVVSHKWKCKDFMNEVVTSFHTGRDFSIYGFSVENKKFFSDGQSSLPILLHNILPGWMANIEVVNHYLLEQGYPEVTMKELDNKQAFINIPGVYLINTLFMSQVTLFIRLANTESVYGSIDEMCDDKVNKQDRTNLDNCFKKPLKDFPEKLQPYLWYYDEQRNLKRNDGATATIQTSLMHNCGVVNWGWIQQEEFVWA